MHLGLVLQGGTKVLENEEDKQQKVDQGMKLSDGTNAHISENVCLIDGVLLLLDCKKRLENLKFIHHASTFALKAVSSTTDKNKPQNQQFRQFW